MATSPLTGLSVDQWLELPEDERSELVEGEVVVSPSPSLDHARAVRGLFVALHDHAQAHGGEVFVAPLGVKLSHDTALEPDVLYVATPDRYGAPRTIGAPSVHRDGVATSIAVPGFAVAVDAVLPD